MPNYLLNDLFIILNFILKLRLSNIFSFQILGKLFINIAIELNLVGILFKLFSSSNHTYWINKSRSIFFICFKLFFNLILLILSYYLFIGNNRIILLISIKLIFYFRYYIFYDFLIFLYYLLIFIYDNFTFLILNIFLLINTWKNLWICTFIFFIRFNFWISKF